MGECAWPALRNFVKKRPEQGRNAPANHKYVRFQEIDNVSEPVRQQVQRLPHHFFGDRITGSMSLYTHFDVYRLNISTGHFHQERLGLPRKLLLGTSGDRRPCRQCFDAAAFPAIAKRTVSIGSEMPSFRGGTRSSMINASVKNDSCTDAGANAGIKDVSVATSRTPLGFRQSSGIGVVIDFDRNAIKTAHLLGQRVVMPDREIRRIYDDAGIRIQRPGRAYADGAKTSWRRRVGEKTANRRGNGVQTVRWRTGGEHWRSISHPDFAVGVHQTGHDL